MKKIFLILFLLAFAVPTWATDYYVSSTGSGTDCTSGSPCAISQATGAAGDNDTIYFKSDDTWTFETAPFLTAVAGVTYRGNYWPSTSSKAKFESGNGIDSDTHALIVINQSDVVFRGFEIDGNSKGQAGGGVYVGYGAAAAIDNITVQDCYIHHTGNPALVAGANSITDPNILSEAWQPNWQYGLYAAGGTDNATHTNFYIIGNEVAYTYHEGIAIYTAWPRTNPRVNGVTVRGNNIHHCGTRQTFTSASGTFGNGGQGLIIANDADNVTAEFNYIHDNGANGFWVRTSPEGTGGGAPNGVVARYNIIATSASSGITFDCGRIGGMDAILYGNIVYDNTGDGVYINGDMGASTFSFYNNTIANINTASRGFTIWHNTSRVTINLNNNIILSTSAYALMDYDGGNITSHSNNLIYRTDGTDANMYYATTVHDRAWVTTFEGSAQNTAPAFVGNTLPTGFSGTYGSNMVPNTDYFQLTVDSPAKDAGATIASYTGCINGAGLTVPLVRPIGAGYDIGAYEYQTSSMGSGITFQGVSIR